MSDRLAELLNQLRSGDGLRSDYYDRKREVITKICVHLGYSVEELMAAYYAERDGETMEGYEAVDGFTEDAMSTLLGKTHALADLLPRILEREDFGRRLTDRAGQGLVGDEDV